MQAFCGAIPLLPGKKEAFKQFIKEAWVTRRKDWVNSDKGMGITKDGWFLQESPQGDWVLIYLEAKDIEKVFREIAASKDQFDVWMTRKIKEYTGVDFSQPPQGPPPTQLVSNGY